MARPLRAFEILRRVGTLLPPMAVGGFDFAQLPHAINATASAKYALLLN